MDITGLFYESEANIGYGGEWRIAQDDSSPGVFVAVAQIARIKIGPMNANIINKTHLRSPGRAHEKKATIRDIGAFVMQGQVNLKHGSLKRAGGDGFTNGGLIAIHRALEERNMEIELADGSPTTVIEFRGVIAELDLGELVLEGIHEFTATVQPLSDWTGSLP